MLVGFPIVFASVVEGVRSVDPLLVEMAEVYGDLVVLDGLDLRLTTRGIAAILGPSGCGKTTPLHITAGLLAPDRGTVSGIGDRRISCLFQEPRLLPWKTVRGNLELVLEGTGTPLERGERIDRLLGVVDPVSFAAAYCHELSGGMRQRVAVARAFAYPGEVMLLDEPFQTLDLALKLSLLGEFERLWRSEPRVSIFATHGVQEALLLGDEILVFSRRPARSERTLVNGVARDERTLRNPRLLELEAELYAAFLDASA